MKLARLIENAMDIALLPTSGLKLCRVAPRVAISEVEHHFLEEYSHPLRLKSSSVPFSNARGGIRVGHGICLPRRTIIDPRV
ncbi:hypothetical protein BSZ18_01415 [Bradyrhizobium canariense]|uniref:Uncharacterized protein n=2 Tax=Bradyrhizobium canariense TaxID=255045 RepID=A0A1X3HFB6_9BRAD|nr:hypothetical protein BST65_01165 [Bradyrhizobium canariense]OSI39328.1 hypothetical protein BST66_01525 [Bradyrhizobium canariense]OSI55440.1 hypothetical protein BSZ20_01790 [Bradyrhizobium canariense]OSI57506.1 hypothetical protein BST67_01835 [Bradyrhizobium canariense]OSI59963.1 hypothetical protein BSZ15_02075 [Bradyrhizobium canariense]